MTVRFEDIEETEPAETELEKMITEYKVAMEEADAKFEDPSSDLENIAPKKVNWDLKMQLEPKLATLRKQTQRALMEIVRDKVSANGTGTQLASAVSNADELSSEEDYEILNTTRD